MSKAYRGLGNGTDGVGDSRESRDSEGNIKETGRQLTQQIWAHI